MAGSDDATLIKVAVWGIAMSVFCTAGLTLLYSDTGNSDYSFDEINSYRQELSSFTGQSMLSATPWVLTNIYTPWIPEYGTSGHVDEDGWLYGESVDVSNYYETSSGTIFHMDPDQKSTVPISVSDSTYDYSVQSGVQWWADTNVIGTLAAFTVPVANFFGLDGHTYATETATNWSYTGYRFVLDPCLPLLVEGGDDDGELQTSVRDGSLSLVWYSYNNQEGLSGGLDVYGGDVLLASYSATDIISAYDSTSGYATTYDFNFEGTHLNLSIRFDQDVIEGGTTLMQAWTQGDWTVAVTSVSAGLFLDVENSNSYSVTIGSMAETFSQIFTFSMPEVNDPLMQIVLWLMVGLPMTLALAIIILRITQAVKPL